MSSQPIARDYKPSGEAIAALISPMLGLVALAISNMLWEADKVYYTEVYLRVGSWMPMYDRIGPFAGKQTIVLVVWLASWGILHLALRKRDVRVGPWAIAFLVGITAAALLLWPPFFELFIPE